MADDKTERPTQRRLDKARREGNFPVSKEFVAAVQFLAFVWLSSAFGAGWFMKAAATLRAVLAAAFRPEVTPESLVKLAWNVVDAMFLPLAVAGGVLLGISLAAQLFTTRLGVSLKKLAPDVTRLNPVARVRDLPRQNLPAFLQAAVLLPVFGFAVYAVARENLAAFARLPLAGIESSTFRMGDAILSLLWRAGLLFGAFGLVDLVRQKRRFEKEMRMTKQEIRDEFKETEGNPQIKQRIRRIQRDFARRQMMKEVPKATAVIVNPTHYAVAIKYSLDSFAAPTVVAKGKNYLAMRIKLRAMEHEVPIVENAPLAQALYKSAEVGQEIPAHLYRAVAEVLAYIYRLMNGRLPG
jgi:flagellar biosynthesis protein FlhB